jgi:DNA-binding response OmpR family regulator
VVIDAARPVLVIEDDLLIGQVIEATLEDAGFEVVWHELGVQGLAAAATIEPCAVLLDLDGQEILRSLKRDVRTRDIPVVIVSAVTASLTADDHALAHAILPKPFTIDSLVEMVRSVQRPAGESEAVS